MENTTEIYGKYDLWLGNVTDDELYNELESIKDDPEEIKDRFYRDLEFGTAGLRGVIAAGTNRMNIYTVERATLGLGNYLVEKYQKNITVAISYDSRNKSREFADTAARCLSAIGIRVMIFPRLEPVPVLSFAVRHLKCQAGIMITASHNPKEYNGYKVYDETGCQITEEAADKILSHIEKTPWFRFDSARTNWDYIKDIDDKVVDKFVDTMLSYTKKQKNKDLKIVYTPLNGSGKECVLKALEKKDYKNVFVVAEQSEPDGNFPTCPYPNPEIHDTMKLGIELAKQEDADLLMATDPDSDRLSIAVKKDDDYVILTGNELGILLTDYILSSMSDKERQKTHEIVTTIVSTMLIDDIANKNNCKVTRTLTGFKYIGERITKLKDEGREDEFILGFEESCGYLIGDFVRDKDAVGAAIECCDMAQKYKNEGTTIYSRLMDLYDTFGHKKTDLESFGFKGITGMETMKKITSDLRESKGEGTFASFKVKGFVDYLDSEKTHLPKADVLEFYFENDTKLIIRPSGTEPKIKAYMFSNGKDSNEADSLLQLMRQSVEKMIESYK